MISIICTGIRDVIQDFLAVEPITLCNGEYTNRAERALGVDV